MNAALEEVDVSHFEYSMGEYICKSEIVILKYIRNTKN
jgi:hypothetical protein